MTQEQRNNPLHGITLERLVTELADHYGFEILAEHININCFKSHPSIKSSLKFLRKTEWAREKVEAFYLYKYKSLPKADDFEYELPPRERTIPEGLVQRPPKKLQKASAEPKDDEEPTHVKKDSLEEHFANEHSSEKYQPKESTQDEVTAEPASSTNEALKPTSGKFNPWAKSSKIEK